MTSNRGALGFDVGQEAVRREAVERAVSTGKPTLTGRITLTRDGVQKAGMAYLLPVYREGAALDSPARRQDALAVVLSAPMVLSEIMDGVTDAANGLLEFELFDGSTAGAGELLFNAVPRGSGTQQAVSKGASGARHLERSHDIVVGGRKLVLRTGTTPAFDATMDRSSLAAVGLVGALASTLLALTVWLLAVGRVRALRLAERMTADLDRLSKVVQITSSAVVLTDPQLRITWVNEAFTKISGYTLIFVKASLTQVMRSCGSVSTTATRGDLPATLESRSRSAVMRSASRSARTRPTASSQTVKASSVLASAPTKPTAARLERSIVASNAGVVPVRSTSLRPPTTMSCDRSKWRAPDAPLLTACCVPDPRGTALNSSSPAPAVLPSNSSNSSRPLAASVTPSMISDSTMGADNTTASASWRRGARV